MDEIWKEIHGHEFYQVSNKGRIRSIDHKDRFGVTRKGKVLAQFRNGNKGYIGVQINYKNVKTHRAVCIAFHGYRDSSWQVNHKNGIKSDNRIENLEWCTSQQNVLHSFRELGRVSCGGHKGKTGSLHHASKTVIGTRLSDGHVETFGSTAEAARKLGIGAGSVPRVCSGKYKHSNGWKFEYANSLEKGILK